MSTPPDQRARLLALARASVEHGLAHDEPVAVCLDDWPAPLRRQRATFVTLRLRDRLRGCIGALEAARPVVEDVAHNAFAAAFRDPRFDPVTTFDYPDVQIHVSVLSPIEPLEARSEAELLGLIRPGVDGLILEEGGRRGTFLPAVWRSLPSAADFLAELKAKAGLPRDYWSETVRISRYTAEEF
jgi:uncharacterized protein